MPAPSKVDQLPEDIRQALEQRLIGQAFSGYVSLSEWLAEQGFEITKSSLQRWGSRFEDRVRALKVSTDQAKAIVAASPDDEGAMSDALMRLTQERMFQVLLELEVDPDTIELPKLARAIADMNRSTITLRRYQTEVRARVAAAAERVEKVGASAGITPETLARIRQEIYGVV